MLRVRLACVKHAASVRSEPGSNSRLKSGVSRRVHCRFASKCHEWERTVQIARLSQMWYVHRYTRRTNRNQTGSGMYHPIVKEQVNPGQLEGLQTNPDTTEQVPKCQAVIQKINWASRCGNFRACG